jgi:hypothetical protein
MKYYNEIEIKDYMDLYKEVWNLKEECLKYLDKDLLSLYQVLVKVNKSIHFLFNMQMTDSLTISGLAMRIFLTDHYKSENKAIPLIINKSIFDDIHKSYYGGRVEVYNPTNKDNKILYYYDVNSLYPYASLNTMPSTESTYIECINYKIDIENLFGFFYCKIKSNNNYIGLLPVRTKTNLIFPLGQWEGWYFSEELKFAKENGYEIEVIKGYKFNKVNSIFSSFVKSVYKIKNNPRNDTERNVAKLILNSIIGRFGINFLKTVTKLVDKKGHDLITTTRILKTFIEIDDNTYLDYYKPNIDKDICLSFGVDYIKALNDESFDESKSSRTYRSVSISTASAVLSYARIHMCKIKLHILNNNGNIYYTDTDSIVTDIKLPEEFVDSKEIGKLKLVHKIKEGYFISDKLYAYKSTENKIIKLSKGVKSKLLKFEDYIKMYNMEVINKATKITSSRNYQEGSVLIKKNDNITLNTNVYNKRERIFENGKWIGTKPIIIKSNNNDNNN